MAGLDRFVASLVGGPAGFPLRDNWFLSKVGHDGLKWVMLVFWLGCLIYKPWRRGALYMGAAILAVWGLKNASPISCPWDLPEYGGTAPTGRCLPAGHPVAGFALFGLYFALRPGRAGRVALVAACAIGLAAGAVQVARGAHFVSHVLWTAWVAWLVTLALDSLARPRS